MKIHESIASHNRFDIKFFLFQNYRIMIKPIAILLLKLLRNKNKQNTVANMIFSMFLFERSFNSELARAEKS